MSDKMIDRTLDIMQKYDFEQVRIFCNRKLTIKSLAPAFALRDFLRKINVDAEIIIENKDDAPDGFQDVLSEPDVDRYLAISVDCQKESDIENNFYRDSTTLLNIYSPLATKGFGVLNFKTEGVSGTSEYMVREFVDYCNENNMELPIEIAEWLYLGIIGATRRFGSNIKKNTMMIAKQLIDMGIDCAKVSFLYERYDMRAIRCQEVILNNLVEKQHYIYAVIRQNDYANRFAVNDFAHALNFFRNITGCYITALFIENDDETYTVLLSTNDYYKGNVKLVARKNNGDGDELFGESIIQPFDIDKVIQDIEIACNKIEK